MDVDVVLIPAHLNGQSLSNKTVIVFDVLRATTTITSALDAGIRVIRAFGDLADAKQAAAEHKPRPILCGELHALPAPGVDLGNSPGQFTAEHAGREIFMATTNGTKAIVAARHAAEIFIGALVNATAAANAAAAARRPVVLLGSGTNGEISMEDAIGAGAVCHLLEARGFAAAGDVARMARQLFLSAASSLPAVLRDCQGGRNIRKVGLDPDIDFAARLDVFNLVGVVDPSNLAIRTA
jgi:2-phosphosulfolactate phosphatase